MHARHSSGAQNKSYDGTNPRDAQDYLNKVWGRAMRRLDHLGIKAKGLRVVEPHHDGCPHWHVLVFVAADRADNLVANIRAYAMADSPNEPGASKHRFKVEVISEEKGSAVAYVAKYVSKNIDGEGLPSDDESSCGPQEASRRVVAWARTWGIRQFQFFGLPPITPTREFYRVDAACLPGQALKEAHQACKENDYAAWLAACEDHALRFRVRYDERASTRYADEVTRSISGLRASGGDVSGSFEVITRTETWRIEPRKGARKGLADAHPWTRFNNSASVDLEGFFEMKGSARPSKSGAELPSQWKDANARYLDLMARANQASASGYKATASKLAEQAWRWALRCESIANPLPNLAAARTTRQGGAHA
jgi:Bacteriophage replication gene A protein (GPA)